MHVSITLKDSLKTIFIRQLANPITLFNRRHSLFDSERSFKIVIMCDVFRQNNIFIELKKALMIDFGMICDSGLENLYYLTEEMLSVPQLSYACTLPFKQLLADGCEDIYSKMLPKLVQTHFFESVRKYAQRYDSDSVLGKIR